MRIYTEVNYIWKDNKLVQTDSESFEYSGEVDKCHERKGGPSYARFNIPHSHSSTVTKITDPIKKGWESSTEAVTEAVDKVKKDNPNPNLNVQTPDKIVEKTKDVFHDAATNISNVIDKNTDTISQEWDRWDKAWKTNLKYMRDYVFSPLKNLPSTATTTDTPTDSPLLDDKYEGGGGYNRQLADTSTGQSTAQRRGITKLHKSMITRDPNAQKKLTS